MVREPAVQRATPEPTQNHATSSFDSVDGVPSHTWAGIGAVSPDVGSSIFMVENLSDVDASNGWRVRRIAFPTVRTDAPSAPMGR